jgi:outer membrane receptor protein involved in Fe transport
MACQPALAATDTLEEIVVTASFRDRPATEVPASLTLLDANAVQELAVQHFEELIGVVPNLNWSGDGHRARYLQIRGVGELEQYQGAPNPSVGFLVDDIDFSGIGTIATLFDVARVEVLRGPQGTRYGANALAGLVYVQSAMPTPDWEGRVQLTAADDNALAGGAAIGGPVTADGELLFRSSAHHYESNGFRDNAYLDRSDTNGRSETTLRGRLSWLPSDVASFELAAFLADVDNGYDAFAIDNSYTMLSDKPGKDAQQSAGASLRIELSGLSRATFSSITAVADSDIDFSFDADWGNDASWAPVTYDYISVSDRGRRTLSQEFRLASTDDGRLFGESTDWLLGLFLLDLEDDLTTINRGEYFDPGFDFADSLDDTFTSGYEATNIAAFGQLETVFAGNTRLTAGLRIERRNTDYADNSGLQTDPSDTMWGGELTLSHDYSDTVTGFVGLSKGYKAGGFNLGAVPDQWREFGDEELWNLEAGIKTLLAGETLTLNASVFYNERVDGQVRLSFQLNPNDPASFGFATVNADGSALGLETEVRWTPGDAWDFYATLGLIDAVIDEIDAPGGPVFAERGAAHAPRYTFAAGAAYRHPSGWFGRVDLSGIDEFYFDFSHDLKSRPYELVHARAGYEADRWSVTVWGRNLFDEEYAVRGFYFGNEPPDFPNTLYTRLGDPRQFGATVDLRF